MTITKIIPRGLIQEVLTVAAGAVTLAFVPQGPSVIVGNLLHVPGVPAAGQFKTNEGSAVLTFNAAQNGTQFTISYLAANPGEITSEEINELVDVANGPGPDVTNVNGQTATTDATPATIFTIPVPTNKSMLVRYAIIGKQTGGAAGTPGDTVGITVDALVKNVAGVVTTIIENGILFSTQIAGATAALTPSGTDAILTVTGALNKNISWTAKAEILEV